MSHGQRLLGLFPSRCALQLSQSPRESRGRDASPNPICGAAAAIACAGGLPPFPAPRLEAIPSAWRVESWAWCQGEAASPGPWCQGEAALPRPRLSPGARSLCQGALEELKDLESVLGDFSVVGGVPPSFHMGSNIEPSLAGLLLGSSHRSL